MADTTDLASLDFANVTPAEFNRLVKKFSKKEIQELSDDAALRSRVLKEVFGRMETQFRPESAGSLRALIRWEVKGATDEVYETKIDSGTCTVSHGRSDGDPRVTLIMNDYEFLKLVSGNGNPVTMFMTRKLKINGDIGLASGLTRLFDIPKG
ncbi:SCP2 sterol-binding domain-containing protein [Streptomyces sp. DSM 44917]|uniref:SCP2 sterol-binding domain-containing protein n=1 Tax=Streptomyces boetiae TaxID=3075541 RepID=A0ABU2LEH7_9ACTN|nr:SCP2 sterol-binding domain-containing protein [Streptomyces sp. DSM 44917]MDT0309966.1 SCP2 sterol-binding domain-containing protein [Streptomyces sp. DSM 44917]